MLISVLITRMIYYTVCVHFLDEAFYFNEVSVAFDKSLIHSDFLYDSDVLGILPGFQRGCQTQAECRGERVSGTMQCHETFSSYIQW